MSDNFLPFVQTPSAFANPQALFPVLTPDNPTAAADNVTKALQQPDVLAQQRAKTANDIATANLAKLNAAKAQSTASFLPDGATEADYSILDAYTKAGLGTVPTRPDGRADVSAMASKLKELADIKREQEEWGNAIHTSVVEKLPTLDPLAPSQFSRKEIIFSPRTGKTREFVTAPDDATASMQNDLAQAKQDTALARLEIERNKSGQIPKLSETGSDATKDDVKNLKKYNEGDVILNQVRDTYDQMAVQGKVGPILGRLEEAKNFLRQNKVKEYDQAVAGALPELWQALSLVPRAGTLASGEDSPLSISANAPYMLKLLPQVTTPEDLAKVLFDSLRGNLQNRAYQSIKNLSIPEMQMDSYVGPLLKASTARWGAPPAEKGSPGSPEGTTVKFKDSAGQDVELPKLPPGTYTSINPKTGVQAIVINGHPYQKSPADIALWYQASGLTPPSVVAPPSGLPSAPVLPATNAAPRQINFPAPVPRQTWSSGQGDAS